MKIQQSVCDPQLRHEAFVQLMVTKKIIVSYSLLLIFSSSHTDFTKHSQIDWILIYVLHRVFEPLLIYFFFFKNVN